ncbi:MAG: PAS domain-containing protein [Thermoanaerobaculaceae bacterium]
MPDPSCDQTDPICWEEELGAAITVADATGRIVAMNRRAAETFAAEGGRALLGSDVFACHPEPARSLLREMYAERRANHYTISRQGQRKIIHQMPVFEGGEFRGFVEISIPIPAELPHFDRG